MFKLIAIEDVQHAGEGRVVCLHYIPNGPGSVCKNRHDEAWIFVARALLYSVAYFERYVRHFIPCRPPQLAASFISGQARDVACWHFSDLVSALSDVGSLG
jgi:hypothetical protein